MFIKRLGRLALIAGCVWLMDKSAMAGEIPNENSIGYIQREIPKVKISAWKGECYEDMVPDTIDIAESARLAINALTGPLDPNMDYELYFAVRLTGDTPMMLDNFDDWCEPIFMHSL